MNILRINPLVGPSGLEPPTSCLSGTRSNLLSYEPMWLVSDLSHLVQCREQISLLSSVSVSTELFSRAVSRKVSSPLQSLTSVFGMGTGGPSAFVTPTIFSNSSSLNIEQHNLSSDTRQNRYFLFIGYVKDSFDPLHVLHRKEVIQPHLPIRLPCYDLTPIIEPTFDSCLLAVSPLASGVFNFHGLTGGVYKARERIHRDMLIRDY